MCVCVCVCECLRVNVCARACGVYVRMCVCVRVCVFVRSDTLQHTATHCNTLQHTATYCNTPATSRASQTRATRPSISHAPLMGQRIGTFCAPRIARARKSVCVALRCSVLHYVAVCCSVLQCVAVRCSVLQCVAVCCSQKAPRIA